MASQKDVAKKMKISQSTVSRALNNDSSLPLETKIMVKKCALEIGYDKEYYSFSNKKANCCTKDNIVLALVYSVENLDNKYYSLLLEMIQGLVQASHEADVSLVIKEIDCMKRAMSIVNNYENTVLGTFLLLRHPEDIVNLFAEKFSCISFNHHYTNNLIKVLEPQQNEAFADMYKYLSQKGHKKIGFFTVSNSYNFAYTRYSGFLQAAFSCGGEWSQEWVINMRSNEQLDLFQVVDRIVHLHNNAGVSAFICTSGDSAKKLILELQKRDIKVPEDISLVAFDDIITPSPQGHFLCGAKANYENMANIGLLMFKDIDAYKDVVSICCQTEFSHGNTVKDFTNINR